MGWWWRCTHELSAGSGAGSIRNSIGCVSICSLAAPLQFCPVVSQEPPTPRNRRAMASGAPASHSASGHIRRPRRLQARAQKPSRSNSERAPLGCIQSGVLEHQVRCRGPHSTPLRPRQARDQDTKAKAATKTHRLALASGRRAPARRSRRGPRRSKAPRFRPNRPRRDSSGHSEGAAGIPDVQSPATQVALLHHLARAAPRFRAERQWLLAPGRSTRSPALGR